MNSRRSTLGLALVVVLAIVAAACAKPPTVELDAAKAALAAARSAEAATYAESALNTADTAMAAVETELKAQEAKFALFRSYKKTKELITAATAAAKQAEEAAVAGKRKAYEEATAARDAAQASLTSVQGMLTQLEACKRKPKGFSKDMELLRGAADGLAASFPEIDEAVNGERYFQAKTQAETVKTQLDQLLADLEQAKTKIGC